jgi:hypothetical protein
MNANKTRIETDRFGPVASYRSAMFYAIIIILVAI